MRLRRCAREIAHAVGDVHGRPDEADHEDEAAVHVGRMGQAPDRLDAEHAGEHEQGDAVGLRGEDLGPPEAEGEAPARRPGGEPGGDEGEADRRRRR